MATETTSASCPPLAVSRQQAITGIRIQLKEGIPLRRLRIRCKAELDAARALKSDWTVATTKLLKGVFVGEEMVEEFNSWVAKFLPEFADLGKFIERYNDEMDQRLMKLHSILSRVENSGDQTVAQQPAPGEAPAAAAAEEAPIVDPPKIEVISEIAELLEAMHSRPQTDASGDVDLSLVEDCLALTPAQRLAQLEEFAEFILTARKANGTEWYDSERS